MTVARQRLARFAGRHRISLHLRRTGPRRALTAERSEPDWLRDRAARGVRGLRRRSRPSRTSSTRPTSTCAPRTSPSRPYVRTAIAPDAGRPAAAPRRSRRAPRAPRGRRRPASSSTGATPPGVDARRHSGGARPRPGRPPSRARGGAGLPDDDRLAAARPRLWTDGVRPRRPGRRPPRPSRSSCAGPPARRSRPLRAHVHPPRRRRRAPRSSRSWLPSGADPAATAGQSFLAGTLEVTLGREAQARSRASRTCRRRPSPSSTATPDRPGRLAPVGARPARLAARPEPRRQPARGRPQLGRAGRDRLRRRGPAVRPDLVHPPRRPGHDRQPALEGRAARQGTRVPEGHDHHRAERDRHRQLPRRVRDEPLEGDALRRDPVARDRPAGLPPGGPRQLGRADRRDPALLPREPRHPARRGAQVHRPRLPRAGRRPRAAGRRPGSPARACSRRSGTPASGAGAAAAA